MTVYMIRHGESANNANGRHSGWAQIPLTDKGFRQAAAAGEKLLGIEFDRVFSSDLKRAVQTCETAMPGRAYEKSALLREIGVGCLMDRLPADCEREYGALYTGSRAREDFTPFGGETRAMVRARLREFMALLEGSGCSRAAVFAHEGALRAMLDNVLGCVQDPRRIVCANCCIAVFDHSHGLWRLAGWNI